MFSLADAASSNGFDFAGFQRGFREAWDFVFPNALVLLLCVGVARYVSKVPLPWLRLPWDKVRAGLRTTSTFLQESNLFGSKLLPAIGLVAIVIVALDVFQLLRVAAHNFLPPNIVTYPTELYSRHASGEVLLRLVVRDETIEHEYDLYDRLRRLADRLSGEGSSSTGKKAITYWDENQGDWWNYAGDFKLLTLVASVSCIAGLRRRYWTSPLRLLVVAIVLTVGFLFCLTKFLFATEQRTYATLYAIEEELRSAPSEQWDLLLRKRAASLAKKKPWLTSPRSGPRVWWELRWLNIGFIARAADLFVSGKPDYLHAQRPLLTDQDFRQLEVSLEGGKSPLAGSEPTPTPGAR